MDFSTEDKANDRTASNFARRFIGILGRKSPIFVNFAPQKPKIGRIGQRVGHAHRCNILREVESASVDIGQSSLSTCL